MEAENSLKRFLGKVQFPQILENLEILENPQNVENEENPTIFYHGRDSRESRVLEIPEISPGKRPLSVMTPFSSPDKKRGKLLYLQFGFFAPTVCSGAQTHIAIVSKESFSREEARAPKGVKDSS